MKSVTTRILLAACVCLTIASYGQTDEPKNHRDVKSTPFYKRIKTSLDAVRAIDTHDHLRQFDEIPNRVATTRGRGMTLYSVWAHSYISRTTRITSHHTLASRQILRHMVAGCSR